MLKKLLKNSVSNNIIISALMTICFILFTYLVGHLDVATVGDAPGPVGFSSVNAVFYKFGYHKLFYFLSEILGYIALLTAAFFSFIGGYQLVTGKSLKAVDGEIYIVGGFYVLVVIFYVFFEKVIINYRPYILDELEGPEASYPSPHTMLAVCIFSSAAVLIGKYIKDAKVANATVKVLLIMMGATVSLRFLSGVHWFTDICGAVLISGALVALYAALPRPEETTKSEEEE